LECLVTPIVMSRSLHVVHDNEWNNEAVRFLLKEGLEANVAGQHVSDVIHLVD